MSNSNPENKIPGLIEYLDGIAEDMKITSKHSVYKKLQYLKKALKQLQKDVEDTREA